MRLEEEAANSLSFGQLLVNLQCNKDKKTFLFDSNNCTGDVNLSITEPGEKEIKIITIEQLYSSVGNDQASAILVPTGLEVQLF